MPVEIRRSERGDEVLVNPWKGPVVIHLPRAVRAAPLSIRNLGTEPVLVVANAYGSLLEEQGSVLDYIDLKVRLARTGEFVEVRSDGAGHWYVLRDWTRHLYIAAACVAAFAAGVVAAVW